jgi:hypothetical protein
MSFAEAADRAEQRQLQRQMQRAAKAATENEDEELLAMDAAELLRECNGDSLLAMKRQRLDDVESKWHTPVMQFLPHSLV